jgi:integrase
VTGSGRRVWVPALAAVGLEGVHIHDLRHTGNQFTANAGANTKELMVRMGHDSSPPRASTAWTRRYPYSPLFASNSALIFNFRSSLLSAVADFGRDFQS